MIVDVCRHGIHMGGHSKKFLGGFPQNDAKAEGGERDQERLGVSMRRETPSLTTENPPVE